MKLRVLLLFFVFTSLLGRAAGQFTTVSGTVIDPNGLAYTNGTIIAALVSSGTPKFTASNQPYTPPTQPVGLNSAGSFIMQLADNTQLTPGGSQWSFQVCSAAAAVPPAFGKGPLCFSIGPLTISGTSQSITAPLTAAALSLTSSFSGTGATLPTAGAPGQIPVSTGPGTTYIAQTKAIYDSRDWTTCDTPTGTATGTNATAGILSMLAAIGSQQATVRIIGTTNPTNSCLVSTISWPSNVTVDFSGGGSLTLINTITPPGSGALDGSVASAFNTSASSCSVTLNVPTAGDAVVLLTNFRFATNGGLGLPSDTKSNVYRLISASNADSNHYSSNTFAWAASNVASGSITITIPYLAAPPASTCAAFAVSGLGPSVGADGAGAQCANSCGTGSPYSTVASATYTAGSFLVAFGGNNATTETCTAGGAFTQILDIGVNMNLCAQIIANSAGGAVTATQAINNTPTGNTWDYNSFGLKPIATTEFITGGIFNPNLHQIFYQAVGTNGPSVDFTGNLAIATVYPEWWGASPNATAAVNTPALQATEHGAFGTSRTNASGLAIYNKQLYLSGMYAINAELQFYDVIGNSTSRWNITCAAGGGLKQTATNLRIWDGQSNAYGTINRCSFQGAASSTNALVDWDFNGVTTAGDLATQFITCYDCSFVGNGSVDTGLLIAKSGGGAQGSNIYCVTCSGQGFTGATEQIGGNGTGRNVGRFYALNALNIGWVGDMQNCPNFGFASYGGGYIEIDNSSFECTSPLASYLTTALSSVDVYCEATQGPCRVNNTRSEDLQLIHASHPVVDNSSNNDQSTAFFNLGGSCLAGGTEPLNWFIHGSDLGSDGALYQVTVHGTAFGGLCLTNASSGNSTTISDTNQRVAGANTVGTFVIHETVTQAVTGSTGTLLNVPVSTGTITGSVTSGTIGVGDTVTQATTAITCKVVSPAPTGSGNLLVNACSGAPDNSHLWTDGTTSGTYTPTSTPAFAPASPVMLITAATGSPDNSHNWTGGTSSAVLVPSAAPVNDVNWTVNAFATSVPAQQQVTIWGGTGAATVCSPITANTATSITFTSCTSTYSGAHAGNFDNTSLFIIEPCWSCGATQSGDFSFVRRDPIIIGGDITSATGSGACQIQDSTASAGYVQCGGNSGTLTRINNLVVTRSDWYGPAAGFKMSDVLINQLLSQVRVLRPYSSQGPGGINWSIGPRNGGGIAFNGPQQQQLGTAPLVESCGASAGGISCNDVSILGRSDPGAGTDIFRNRVEYTGMLGAPAPSGFNLTDQNGSPTRIGGGPPTGAGTPGNIEFWMAPGGGGSGVTPQTGAMKAGVDTTGLFTADGSFGSKQDQGSSACETSFAPTTLNTGATTTNTGLNCLPATAIIDAVVYRITTTITTAANFTIGDGTTAARFCAAQSTLTIGTTGICFAQADQTGAPGPRQVSAATVRVTTNVNPGAGAIRLIVYYHTWTAPTS